LLRTEPIVYADALRSSRPGLRRAQLSPRSWLDGGSIRPVQTAEPTDQAVDAALLLLRPKTILRAGLRMVIAPPCKDGRGPPAVGYARSQVTSPSPQDPRCRRL